MINSLKHRKGNTMDRTVEELKREFAEFKAEIKALNDGYVKLEKEMKDCIAEGEAACKEAEKTIAKMDELITYYKEELND
jgi:predicted  nucleic acid-binding Zn-ribbon protein